MVGGAMALVFARQSGAQTRDMLREWAITLKEEVEDGVFRARTTLQAPFVRDEDL
jgi:gas vesicle protein